MKLFTLFLFSFSSLLFIGTSDAVRCYQCYSAVDVGCLGEDLDKYLEECSPRVINNKIVDAIGCQISVVLYKDQRVSKLRDCAYKGKAGFARRSKQELFEDEKKAEIQATIEFQCNKDACNNVIKE